MFISTRVAGRIGLLGLLLTVMTAGCQCSRSSTISPPETGRPDRGEPDERAISLAKENFDSPTLSAALKAQRDGAFTYWKCDENKAETVLVVDVTIDEATDHRFTFPLRKEPAYDAHGLPVHRFPREHSMICADSFSPRSWCNGAVNFEGASAADVTVEASYGWMTARGVEGSLDEKVTVTIGQSLERRLSEHAVLKAFWRPPWPKATVETIPFFVAELGGRDSNEAGWRLVGMGRTAIPALIEALKADGDGQRGTAAWALGRIGLADDGAREALVRALRQDGSPYVRAAAASALELIQPSEEVLAALADATKDPDKEVRAAAQWSLDHLSGKKEAPPPADKDKSDPLLGIP